MSLKARLRLAVALLMSAMVAVLSGLYMRGYLEATFRRAHDTANSLADQLQASILERLQRQAAESNPRPSTPEQAKQFWRGLASNDPSITSTLERAVRHWGFVSEVFITSGDGQLLASSAPQRKGPHGEMDLAEWTKRSLLENLRQVYIDRQDTEVLRPIAIIGETTPVLNIHVVVSPLFLRRELQSGLFGVLGVCAACLVASVILALVLPNFVLSPLERLSQNLDRMATGQFNSESESKHEAREFAAVYTKLSNIDQQFQGARANVDELRGNVEQLLERLEEAVLLFDASGRVTMAGRAVRRLLDRDPAALVGSAAEAVFPGDSGIGQLVRDAIATGSPARNRSCVVWAGDREFTILVDVQPVHRSSTGARLGALVTLRDVESRDEVAAQLDLANRLAALSQVTHGVAHEIKNPLNAITLHLEVLRARLADGDEAPELNVIRREIQRLDRVVKTFLDFNRPVRPDLRHLDLNDIAHEVVRLVRPEAESRNIIIDLRTTQRPAMMNGDRDLLQQAVLNVVVNAVDAMPGGGLLRLETLRGGGRIELLVSDSGPGIPPEIRKKIFDLYFSTKERGSGIGLAMTFRFVQLLDGKIEVASESGRGATFRFSFPEAFTSRSDSELSRALQA
ncbi:MAG: PAS domain-containing protein [Acidobacteria bacterium]|nr:PAS domain-containing protein [Acidobacteriota bacterium]